MSPASDRRRSLLESAADALTLQRLGLVPVVPSHSITAQCPAAVMTSENRPGVGPA